MRPTLVALAAAIVMLALPLAADEKPTEAYQKAMRDNAEATRELRAAANEIENSGAGAQDYEPFVKATTTMKTSYAVMLAFWQARKADDAIKFAQDGAKLVADLEAAAKDRDYRMVLDSLTALNDTCTACHMAYRTRLPDGSFEIK
jgi:cytochrome c556